MRNIKITTAYKGTNYSGWQIQPGYISIQEIIEEKLSLIFNEKINITGSGRTDAGVHAFEQVANFITNNDKILLNGALKGLNSLLPNDISVLNIEEVDIEFNARKSAKKKTYVYKIYNEQIRNPFYENLYLHYKGFLNIEKMNEGAKLFIGTKDFASFCASQSESKTTTRTIYDAFFKQEGNIINFYITGNGFLMKMVRNIVGILLEVGSDRITIDKINGLLNNPDKKCKKITAPPQGLYLEKVYYEKYI